MIGKVIASAYFIFSGLFYVLINSFHQGPASFFSLVAFFLIPDSHKLCFDITCTGMEKKEEDTLGDLGTS